MTNENKTNTLHAEPATGDPLTPLFRHAQARPQPAAEDEREVRAAVREEWLAITARRRRNRIGAFAVAASALIAVSLVLLRPAALPTAELPSIASVARTSGLVLSHRLGSGDDAREPLARTTLQAGDVLNTSSGALVALEWNDGASLRLDENTELVLHSEDEIELIQGRIYVDSGVDRAAAAPVSLSIQTHAGMVRHIGTQYLTAVQTAGIVVSVREGEVQVGPESGAASVRRGEQLSVSLDGEITQQVIPIHGAMWEWTERITPPLELDGMTALAFVQWAARETGHELVFESDAARQLAGETQLRGAVAQEPQRALYLILQTSDLEHEVSGGNILVRIRAGAG